MDKNIKHRIIDKILVSDDEKLLHTVDQLMESASNKNSRVTLSREQIEML